MTGAAISQRPHMHIRASGVRDRKFAGFAVSTTTAPDSTTGNYYSQGDSVATSSGEQSDGYAQINHPFRKDVFDLSSNIKQRTYFRWDTVAHGNSTFVGLGRQMHVVFSKPCATLTPPARQCDSDRVKDGGLPRIVRLDENRRLS